MAKETHKEKIETVNRFILDKQHLSEDTKIDDIVQITRDIGGLHATSPTTPYLSLFARSHSFTKERLQEELYIKKSLAKVTYVRRTIFILPKDMLPLTFAAVRRNADVMTDQHLKYLEMPQEEYEITAGKIFKVLGNREFTLKELKAEMGDIPNLMYIVRMMCFQGLLIRSSPKSGWKSSLNSYAPFSQYYPDLDMSAPCEKEAQSSVIELYIANYGPVTEKDITWWTGFSKSAVRGVIDRIQNKLSYIKISDFNDRYYILKSQLDDLRDGPSAPNKTVTIAPCLDPYLMGYKDRDRYIAPEYYSYIYDRSGNATTTILYEGKVVGIWDYDPPLFKYFLFKNIEQETMNNLKIQAEKTGRFISGEEIKLKPCESMKPLVKRTAGGVMSPLKES